ncbi:MAG: methylenetetrahydrofolate reductase C-terminal domain-containing protein [Candidatus Omnitrophica bacterium]|nr:methylenetetrahydrofolate reductase C-terminal domain-containing protein [Candidatus Omnitrophota bacterium]MCM8794062.1 methylenetetrahydrofolate reductase C-terminal domain-containing protein [Candidatus Omnitrophota bacterium]
MIISEPKPWEEIVSHLKKGEKIFIVGCGECSTTCKTGGEREVLEVKQKLEKEGYQITGFVIPKAPCVSAQIKLELSKNKKAISEADSILVMACGLGGQSVKINDRQQKPLHIATNTLFMGGVDSTGLGFFEYCSACGNCVLELTAGICPITRCAKGLLNGPCGGQNKGKCEVDKEKDCAWVLIYEELKKQGELDLLKEIKPPRDYTKKIHPQALILK